MLKSSSTLLLILIRMISVITFTYKSVVKVTLTLCSDLMSNLGAKGLTASAKLSLNKNLPDYGGDDPFGALKGGIKDLQDGVVDAWLDSVGKFDIARVVSRAC
jgi:hypothetical protein